MSGLDGSRFAHGKPAECASSAAQLPERSVRAITDVSWSKVYLGIWCSPETGPLFGDACCAWPPWS